MKNIELPDGALETARIEIVKFVDGSGKEQVAYSGDSIDEGGIALYEIVAMLGFAKVCMIADLNIEGGLDE